jgi:Carboxypeptidase regulatory-like domain
MLLALAAALAATVVAADPITAVTHGDGAIVGTVTLTDARDEAFDAPGVRLTLTCTTMPTATRVAISDDHGAFRFIDVPPDRCSITADLQGFAAATEFAVVRRAETARVAMHLDVAAVGAGVQVVKGACAAAEGGESSHRPVR